MLTFIYTCKHACMHTYVCTYIYTCTCASIVHVYVHACIRTYSRTYVLVHTGPYIPFIPYNTHTVHCMTTIIHAQYKYRLHTYTFVFSRICLSASVWLSAGTGFVNMVFLSANLAGCVVGTDLAVCVLVCVSRIFCFLRCSLRHPAADLLASFFIAPQSTPLAHALILR